MAGEGEKAPETTARAAEGTDEGKSQLCRCVVLTGYGGLSKVDVQLRPKPKPGEGHVLIKVHACGVNFADIMQRQGMYPSGGEKVPYVMGFECAGVVEEVGTGVTELEVGARVVAWSMTFGMMAEYVSLPAIQAVVIPDSMTFEDAAALPINYVTAYHILFDVVSLKEGDSILIHMAAGGVGVAATQLCKIVPNVTVFGTASADKHEKIKAQGVTHPIDYHSTDYAREVRKILPDGVDVVMDPLSGKDTLKGYDLLAPLGRIVCYGIANAVKGQPKSIFNKAKQWYNSVSFSASKIYEDSKSVAGYRIGNLGKAKPSVISECLKALNKLYKEGKIKPEIHAVLSLEEMRDAMRCIQERKNVGKIILSPLKLKPEEQKKKVQKEEGKKEEKEAEKEAAETTGGEEKEAKQETGKQGVEADRKETGEVEKKEAMETEKQAEEEEGREKEADKDAEAETGKEVEMAEAEEEEKEAEKEEKGTEDKGEKEEEKETEKETVKDEEEETGKEVEIGDAKQEGKEAEKEEKETRNEGEKEEEKEPGKEAGEEEKAEDKEEEKPDENEQKKEEEKDGEGEEKEGELEGNE